MVLYNKRRGSEMEAALAEASFCTLKQERRDYRSLPSHDELLIARNVVFSLVYQNKRYKRAH